MESIVSDATTLIVLGRLDRYDLLENLFRKIYIPQEVMREVSKKSDGVSKKIHTHTLFEIREIHDFSLLKLLDSLLDLGESEAIVLAKELDMILLIDEKKGRNIAKNMGLEIIGLLGVLILNVRKEKISKEEAVAVLDAMKDLNFRVSQKLEASFLLAMA